MRAPLNAARGGHWQLLDPRSGGMSLELVRAFYFNGFQEKDLKRAIKISSRELSKHAGAKTVLFLKKLSRSALWRRRRGLSQRSFARPVLPPRRQQSCFSFLKDDNRVGVVYHDSRTARCRWQGPWHRCLFLDILVFQFFLICIHTNLSLFIFHFCIS